MKEKIEEILNRYGVATRSLTIQTEDAVSIRMMTNTALIMELSTLIQQEREEAVRGYAEYISKNARKSEGHSLAEDGVPPFLMIDVMELSYLVETYLSQQKGSALKKLKKELKGTMKLITKLPGLSQQSLDKGDGE